ncbi:MAG: hypothetical protein Q9201_000262 [Fulgogasparrea decipioides]
MARNVHVPLTSLDIVRQQSYQTNTRPYLKRSFEQSSLNEPQLSHEGLAISGPSRDNVPVQRSSGLHPATIVQNRLVASRICNTSHPPTQSATEAACASGLDVSSIPSSSLNPLLSLSHPRYGLPEPLVKNFASMGIRNIYPWQSSCLLGRGLLSGEKNLVYTAPTGGGKSLVADVLMLKKVLGGSNKKGILVLPYVALVQEKVNWLRKAVEGVDKDPQTSRQLPKPKFSRISRSVRIVGFFGGSKTRATWFDVDIAVCTFEKAFDLERNKKEF